MWLHKCSPTTLFGKDIDNNSLVTICYSSEYVIVQCVLKTQFISWKEKQHDFLNEIEMSSF